MIYNPSFKTSPRIQTSVNKRERLKKESSKAKKNHKRRKSKVCWTDRGTDGQTDGWTKLDEESRSTRLKTELLPSKAGTN